MAGVLSVTYQQLPIVTAQVPVVALCVGLPSFALASASAGEFFTGEYEAHT